MVPIIISTETMWLSFAPIASQAEAYYGVSSLAITWSSLSYMLMFILFSLPASWVIDRWGYRPSLIIGAVLTAVFGLLRAIFAEHWTLVLIMQFIIAIGQPFLLNITTKAAANWFPMSERSTAAGILTMAQYLGFVVPMVVAPIVAESSGIPDMLMVFAIIGIVSAVIAIAFTKEKPLSAISDETPPREAVRLESIKSLVANRHYSLILFVSFVSIGIFNTLLTLLETILGPRGFTSEQSGIVGAVFIVAGIIGAVVLPLLSDKKQIRVPFFIGAIAILLPALIGLTYGKELAWVAIIAGIAGFAIMGVAPILFQHGSEAAYPIPEGTSLGMILLMGQVSGAVFVYLFQLLVDSSGSIVPPMLIFAGMTAILLPLTFRMKASVRQSAANTTNQTPLDPGSSR
ncbi:FLVCR family MFS transporter 7 [Paenibacillus cellulosilyticus]|uniref:FLVCR family MFS transporter 7 n=1 Tax=Paenibacillus cellulosilyticus TaxID=375489 RepID=A0A2V2Z0C0_9BACL|nr:FLVCR family MFS transporter 7 [Paenibacillus cellulosilyticus]QKS46494.1 MFS transporter [Paenibacillus cellulosilyticus]